VEFEGIAYGPIVATALRKGRGSTLRCAKCWQAHSSDDAWLDQVIECPTPGCDLHLRVNPFVVEPPQRTPR
jgi:hypothetical protein